MKRCFDFIVALTALIVLSPIMVVVAAAIRMFMGKPVLFRQWRPGLHGVPFQIYKFRTMKEIKDQHGVLLADDQRLTKLGKILRKLSLDELPQFINVIKGELSLVGPRPLLMEYLPLYNERQARRHEVKPGITGWAQVNGRNALTWEEKFELDVWYVENHRFWLDIKILGMTVMKVFRADGISSSNHATMPAFKGNTSQDR